MLCQKKFTNKKNCQNELSGIFNEDQRGRIVEL